LFGVPLLPASLATAVSPSLYSRWSNKDIDDSRLAIAGLLGLVFLGLSYDLILVGTSPVSALHGLVIVGAAKNKRFHLLSSTETPTNSSLKCARTAS
jgi:hypothetical protein